MFGKILGGAALTVAIAGASLVLTSAPAVAQPSTGYGDDAGASVGGVTVYAPHRYARQPTTGALVRMDSVSMAVPLGDLDLSTRWGAHVAKARIERAARDVCQEAEDVYPNDVPAPGSCYAQAVHEGLAQAQDAAGYPIVAWNDR